MADRADGPDRRKQRKRKGSAPKRRKRPGGSRGEKRASKRHDPSGKRKAPKAAKPPAPDDPLVDRLTPEERAQGELRADMLRSLGHCLRRRILRVFFDEGNTVARSPKQIASVLNAKLSSVSYQVSVLRNFGVLKSAGTVPVRGTLEHFYRATADSDPPIEALLEETRKLDDEDARLERALERKQERERGRSNRSR